MVFKCPVSFALITEECRMLILWLTAVVVQLLSNVQLSVVAWSAACQTSLSFTISLSLHKFMFIELMMPSNHVILCHPLLHPSNFPSTRVFSKDLVLHIMWLKYWSFIFSISPSNEYSGLISFMIDWVDLLAVHCSLRSFLQHYSSKVSILWHSILYMVQPTLSHQYMTTGKTMPRKVHLVKASVFPVVMYGCKSWTIKKPEHQRTDAF